MTTGSLRSRLDRLETSFVPDRPAARVFRIVAAAGDETRARQIAEVAGYSPAKGDTLVLRSIVSVHGHPPAPFEPYIR